MPSRFVSLVILVYWLIAAFCLLTWDVIPELTLGNPPDLRVITLAADSSKPVRWSIQVNDDPRFPDVRRVVGDAVTKLSRRPDGWVEMTSKVEIDAGGLLKGTAFLSRSSLRLWIDSHYQVEPTGNLRSFSIEVKSRDSPDTLIDVKGQLKDKKDAKGQVIGKKVAKGQVKGKEMEIVSKGPIPILNKRVTIDYEPRSVVHDVLGPLDRLPGLHVGQRWDSQVINPFTGQVDRVRVEVARRGLIHWAGNPVTTFEVVQHAAPLSMRTWVRLDGVILRQEVPFPFVRLVLERRPEQDDFPSLSQTRVPGS
jgi:hypothetical protein